jgi:ribulose-5-phosphate 4-epimerase/fuculose-1-phosphate aldolase
MHPRKQEMEPMASPINDVVTTAVEAHWALAAAGLSDMVWGHASIRRPDGTGIVMKAAGWSFEEIQADRIVGVSWESERIDGTGKIHIEVPIHTQIMLARPDVGCVVHTHAPAVAAFASLNVEMRPISHDGVIFADGALPRFELTGNLISTPELGKALAGVLGDAPAVTMPCTRHFSSVPARCNCWPPPPAARPSGRIPRKSSPSARRPGPRRSVPPVTPIWSAAAKRCTDSGRRSRLSESAAVEPREMVMVIDGALTEHFVAQRGR